MGGNPADARLMVGLLGPVEIGRTGGVMTGVAQPRLRVLLGMLGIAAGRVVSGEALVEGLWGEEWSPRRELNLHGQVSALRRRLEHAEPGRGGARLARVGPGYRLALGPGELDTEAFGGLAGRGRAAARAGDAAAARDLFGQALGLWRGLALADAAPLCPRLAGEAARLEEARLAVMEERIGADLALGRHGEVAGELAGLVAQFPLREGLACLLMTALFPPPTAAPARSAPSAPPAAGTDGRSPSRPATWPKPRPPPTPPKRRSRSRPTTPAGPGWKAPCTRPPATARGAPATAACPKTRLDHVYMACALNLLRLEAYWTGTPLDRQRTSHLARLELGLAA